MSKRYTGSPVPINRPQDDSLFKMEDKPVTIRKSYSPIERQRMADGTPHTFTRPSAVEPKDYDLYIKMDKSQKEDEDKSLNAKKCDPDEVVKAFMES